MPSTRNIQGSSIFRDDLLLGQVALVTGGGSGIGAAIASELAHLGAQVVIAARKPQRLKAAAAELSARCGRQVIWRQLDIRDRDQVQAVVSELVQTLGGLHLLVNNGGGQFFSPAEQISGKGFDAVVATNLTGTWNMTRAAADHWMLANGGCVLNITMLTARGFPGMAHSVAARAGVEAMSRTLAVEWAARGVRLNCIAPGVVSSSGLRQYPAGLGVLEKLPSLIPLKRLASRQEIAWLVAYLASPAGRYVTGQTWVVDGGKDLWGDLWPIPDPKDLSPAIPELEPWE